MFTIKPLKPQAARATKRELTQLGRGIVRGNPRRCFKCRKPIRRGEAWIKQTSPDRAYSVILHAQCNGMSE